jgi:putative transposase
MADRQFPRPAEKLRRIVAFAPTAERAGSTAPFTACATCSNGSASVRQAYWQALGEAVNERDAKQRLQGLVDELDNAAYTAAAKCLADDLEALVVHLRYPTRQRRRWRSTNLLERSLGEVKRRTKVIGRFRGETSCLTLVWAVLDLYITHATNGINFTQLERQRLRPLRYEGTTKPPPRR